MTHSAMKIPDLMMWQPTPSIVMPNRISHIVVHSHDAGQHTLCGRAVNGGYFHNTYDPNRCCPFCNLEYQKRNPVAFVKQNPPSKSAIKAAKKIQDHLNKLDKWEYTVGVSEFSLDDDEVKKIDKKHKDRERRRQRREELKAKKVAQEFLKACKPKTCKAVKHNGPRILDLGE